MKVCYFNPSHAALPCQLTQVRYSDIKQRQVETVIPEVGGRVVVVLGGERGKVGRLLQKSTSKETAVVQFEGDWAGEVGTFRLDDISEYRGE